MPNLKHARQFMQRELVTLPLDLDVLQAVERLVNDNISGAPVIDDAGRYQGVFSEKCSLTALTTAAHVAAETGLQIDLARDFMVSQITTVSADNDVFDAIDHLLKRRISGAPVIDGRGQFLGVFSEKTAMRVLAAAAHDQLPGTNVGSYMNTDRARIISRNTNLLEVAELFLTTPFRRLPVLEGEQIHGQISRRDVLRAELRLAWELVRVAREPQAAGMLNASTLSATVADFIDRQAETITESTDLLTIAQRFINTPYRRLPVLSGERVVGQVSRRDVLSAASDLLRPDTARPHAETLYLSNVQETRPPSLG